jgi:hypothetical protein
MITGATITGPKGTMRGVPARRILPRTDAFARRSSRGRRIPWASRSRASLFAQNLGPALHVVARQVQIVAHLVRNILGQICPHPAADLFAKSLFFGVNAKSMRCLLQMLEICSTHVLFLAVRVATNGGKPQG